MFYYLSEIVSKSHAYLLKYFPKLLKV